MIYVFLATGFEEIEALSPIDILRRAGLPVQTVSVTGERLVYGSHQIGVEADILFDEMDLALADMLILPGGMPGSAHLDACQPLREAIRRQYEAGKPLAAICAAPKVYGHMGILRGVRVTCYPGCEDDLEGAFYTGNLVEVDGQFITGKGPGASMEFGYTIAEAFLGEDVIRPLREGMVYAELAK